MIKLIIAGGRDFNRVLTLKREMLNYDTTSLEVVCGGAKGADTYGERWAKKNNVPIKYFLAEWDKYDNAAGYIRNRQMAEYGTHLLAFWDGESRGTKNMIDTATELGLNVQIVMYNNRSLV